MKTASSPRTGSRSPSVWLRSSATSSHRSCDPLGPRLRRRAEGSPHRVQDRLPKRRRCHRARARPEGIGTRIGCGGARSREGACGHIQAGERAGCKTRRPCLGACADGALPGRSGRATRCVQRDLSGHEADSRRRSVAIESHSAREGGSKGPYLVWPPRQPRKLPLTSS